MVNNCLQPFAERPEIRKCLSFIKHFCYFQQKQLIVIVVLMNVLMALGQRAPFAGKRPNGYKDRLQTDNNTDNNGIADRIGENTNTGVTGTTQRLPHLALGDREAVDLLNTYPADQRPFWLINSQHIEAQKNEGRPALNVGQNSADVVNRFGTGPVDTAIPNYPSVVYPIAMTADQRQQAQQMFNNQIQQITNNNQPIKSNPIPSRIDVQQPVQQQIINGGPKQTPVQGRLPLSSGYNG